MTLGSSGKAQEAIKDLSKIDKNQWIGIATHMDFLGSLVGISGTDVDILGNITGTLKDAITTEINAILAPLKNEIYAMINEALEPIMPYVEEIMNGVLEFMQSDGIASLLSVFEIGLKGWEAIFTGKWDEFWAWMYKEFGEEQTKFREGYEAGKELGITNVHDLLIMEGGTPWSVEAQVARAVQAELNRRGTEGGVYSGQFDIDPVALAKMLENMDVGDYDG